MRKILNTVYVTREDAYVSLDGLNIVIKQGAKEIGRVTSGNFEQLVVFGYAGVSPAVMGFCVENKISICFLKPSGRFLARVEGDVSGNVLLRKEQYRISDDEHRSAVIARNSIAAKVFNANRILERSMRDHELRIDLVKMRFASDNLKSLIADIKICTDLDSLRGLEGKCAEIYFNVFDEMILRNKEDFYLKCRNRRPPLDNVNALLSFVYTLLFNDCASALSTVGLDPYVGFLHRDRPGRRSLALDLAEEFRSIMAERCVLKLINLGKISPDGFETFPDGAVKMDDETRQTVIFEWQNHKTKEMIVHPFLEEKIPWGLAPYAQAMLLARYIRGEIDAYPPFFWK